MKKLPFLSHLFTKINQGKKLLAVLIDPDGFSIPLTKDYLEKLPIETDYIFVGGSTVEAKVTNHVVAALKQHTALPIVLFPGDVCQLTEKADALLLLNLLSGRNPDYLIGQQLRAVPFLKKTKLEVIPTAYLLIDGGNLSSVARVTQTEALPQNAVEVIINTALAGQFMGARLVYLEAGSGAKWPVNAEIITQVKQHLSIPVIVGGGIRTVAQREAAYRAGADLVVMGTVFEDA